MVENHLYDANERRANDHWKEKCLSQFLEKHFYPRYKINTTVVVDKEAQLKGIDKKFRYGTYNYYCDEKGSTSERYFDKTRKDYRKLNTFCLECYQVPRGKDYFINGWFMNPDKDTNSYLLTWIDSASPKKWNGEEDIKEVECILVRYDRIMEFLNTKGITLKVIKEVCEELMHSKENYKFVNGIKFNHLYNYSENPINIQLTREDYRSICDIDAVLKRKGDVVALKRTA